MITPKLDLCLILQDENKLAKKLHVYNLLKSQ